VTQGAAPAAACFVLQVLGGGFRAVEVGGQTFVQSVPKELDRDANIVIQAAQVSKEGVKSFNKLYKMQAMLHQRRHPGGACDCFPPLPTLAVSPASIYHLIRHATSHLATTVQHGILLQLPCLLQRASALALLP